MESENSTTAGSHATEPQRNDLATLSSSELIARINELETRLKETTAQLSAISTGASLAVSATTSPQIHVASATKGSCSRPRKNGAPPMPLDFSRYNTRHIALKFAYLGHRYSGLEHTNGSKPPLRPTIEEALWKALRKTRLIPTDVDPGCDESFEVVFGEQERKKLYREDNVKLECNWSGLAYSKCGRTDRGVSAFGQVVALRVRSNRPKEKDQDAFPLDVTTAGAEVSGQDEPKPKPSTASATFDDVGDELPYATMLNSVLPPDIKVLAWCANPDPSFDARFACKERRYKYFFTNPAFCPTPGDVGLELASGKHVPVREGWLDIEAMQIAAKKLEGLHDFRNFCKIDASKQMSSCERRITFAGIEQWQHNGGLDILSTDPTLNKNGESGSTASELVQSVVQKAGIVSGPSGPEVYTFTVHGTAFLWHQIRCMIAVLFLVGQGLEVPEVVDELLDIAKNPAKPVYGMASDTPLVLWDCVFSGNEAEDDSGLKWIYVGDKASIAASSQKGTNPYDSKFGTSGLANDLWSQWRDAKMQETLTASLLGLVLNSGDGTSLQRGGFRASADTRPRGQRFFDGGTAGRNIGDYVPVMQRPCLDTLEVQNAKYLAGKQARRDMRKLEALDGK